MTTIICRTVALLVSITAAPVEACAGAMGRYADWDFLGNALLWSVLPLVPVEFFILKIGLKSNWILAGRDYVGCLIAKLFGFLAASGAIALFAFNINLVALELAYSIGHWMAAAIILQKFHVEAPFGRVMVTAGLTSTVVPWLSSFTLYWLGR
jgi:hypothetical protein